MFIIFKNENSESKSINSDYCESLYIVKSGVERFKLLCKLSNAVEPITLVDNSTKDKIYEIWDSFVESIECEKPIWKIPD